MLIRQCPAACCGSGVGLQLVLGPVTCDDMTVFQPEIVCCELDIAMKVDAPDSRLRCELAVAPKIT